LMATISRYTGGVVELTSDRLEDLRARLQGEVLLPDDADYDTARTVWNAAVDKRPALIARCVDATDVAEAVKFARRHDILVSVRCGGHNIAGKAVAENGLMIDLTPICECKLNRRTRPPSWVVALRWETSTGQPRHMGSRRPPGSSPTLVLAG
jgi:hypothetical protein